MRRDFVCPEKVLALTGASRLRPKPKGQRPKGTIAESKGGDCEAESAPIFGSNDFRPFRPDCGDRGAEGKLKRFKRLPSPQKQKPKPNPSLNGIKFLSFVRWSFFGLFDLFGRFCETFFVYLKKFSILSKATQNRVLHEENSFLNGLFFFLFWTLINLKLLNGFFFGPWSSGRIEKLQKSDQIAPDFLEFVSF